MFNELDEALRQLLIRELPIRNGEIDISFDHPKREWSARLNRPTLNLFLHDVRENMKLRQAHPLWDMKRENNKMKKKRTPVRIDIQYMITAWANEPEDEHRLLTRTLLGLFRTPELPEDLLTDNLLGQPAPITLMAAQADTLRNPAEIWGALDNELRPTVPLTVTMALDPYYPITEPLIRTRELRVEPSVEYPPPRLNGNNGARWTIGGRFHTDKSLEEAQVILVEQGRVISLLPEDRFMIGNLEAGNYTLQISLKDGTSQTFAVQVPSTDYEFEV